MADLRQIAVSLGAGLLFGGGLVVSGMIDPANVLGFFDVLGQWNPTLAFVMAGGLAVSFLSYRLKARRAAPCLADSFQMPTVTAIDFRLLGGAALFGLGWGLAGYCPGPAIAATGAGFAEAVWFTAAMLAGMVAYPAANRAWIAARSSGVLTFRNGSKG